LRASPEVRPGSPGRLDSPWIACYKQRAFSILPSIFQAHLLSLILTTPLAGAAVLLVVPRRVGAIRRVAAIAAGLGFLLSVPLWFRYDPQGPPWQLTERAALIPSIGASYFVGVDGFSVLLVLTTTLIGLLAMLSSWPAITERVRAYSICLLVLQTAVLGLLLALDALLYFVCWCAMVGSMGLLIGLWGTGRRRRPAIRFLLYSLTGGVALLVGILAIGFHAREATGIYSFDLTAFHGLTIPPARQRWIFLGLLAGFAVQVPMVPFHGWLRDALTDAPTAVAALLAAVMPAIGIYGLVRFSLPILPEASRAFIPMIAGLSLVAIGGGALWALVQTDWKRLIGCLGISQMGLATLGLFVIAPAALSASLLQQISRGSSMAGLFLMLGIAHDRRGASSISALGGLWTAMPAFCVLFLVLALSSIGLPGVGGLMMLRGVSVAHRVWAATAAAGIGLGAVCLVWRCKRLVFGPIVRPGGAARQDLTARELATIAPLVAVALWTGLYPAPLLARLEPTMARVITRLEPGYAPAFSKVPGCGSTAAPAPSAPPGFTAIAPCDDPSAAPKAGNAGR
jgi:NADH-quinone oxidoreductase subunit M